MNGEPVIRQCLGFTSNSCVRGKGHSQYHQHFTSIRQNQSSLRIWQLRLGWKLQYLIRPEHCLVVRESPNHHSDIRWQQREHQLFHQEVLTVALSLLPRGISCDGRTVGYVGRDDGTRADQSISADCDSWEDNCVSSD